MFRNTLPLLSMKKVAALALASLALSTSSGANAVAISNVALTNVYSGTDSFGRPICSISLSWTATGQTVDPQSGNDLYQLRLGSATAPSIHGVTQYAANVGVTAQVNSPMKIDRQGAYTPEPYSIRFYDTSVIGQQQLPPVIAEIAIPQAALRAAGGVCLDAVVTQRSPRNGTLGN